MLVDAVFTAVNHCCDVVGSACVAQGCDAELPADGQIDFCAVCKGEVCVCGEVLVMSAFKLFKHVCDHERIEGEHQGVANHCHIVADLCRINEVAYACINEVVCAH